VIENNRYAEFTDSDAMRRGASLTTRALSYGLDRADTVDGNDVQAVSSLLQELVAGRRAGAGPCLVEAITYRWHGHYEGDPGRYRENGELERWQERDPLRVTRELIADAGLAERADTIIREAQLEMDRAVELALAAPYPDDDALLKDVYA
jgi:TPP-dependent pyruvate/acetoin dehydrogenase alpha subunit